MGSKFALPTTGTFAIGFYNSLYYRTNRE